MPQGCCLLHNVFCLDDLGSIDFITRLRLSKILDQGGRWQNLAKTLSCGHMIELIGVVCSDSEDPTSPTILFLDQYEVTVYPKILESVGRTVKL